MSRATIVTCDRCGTFEDAAKGRIEAVRAQVTFSNQGTRLLERTLDLCPGCRSALVATAQAFLQPPKEKAHENERG